MSFIPETEHQAESAAQLDLGRIPVSRVEVVAVAPAGELAPSAAEVEAPVRAIRLALMTEAEFLTFRETEARGYADDKIRSGDWIGRDAMTLALQAIHRLVPSGPGTAGHHLFTVHDAETGVKVGWLWFEVRDDGLYRSAFLNDIFIFDEHQRRGYGTACLAEFDNQARTLGIRRVRLHVFGHNTEAKKLYERCGYQVTDCTMAKDLS